MPMFETWRKTKLQKRAHKKRTHKKKTKEQSMLQKQVFVGIVIVIVLSLLGTAVWYGTRIESLQITQVEVVGGYTIPHTVVEDTVRERLAGAYFMFIPHTFRATYPKHSILENIYTIPRVKNVEIEVVDTQKVVVVFEEYQPHALWCENYQTEDCLFLDSVGFAFATAPELTGSAFIRYVDTNRAPEVKTQAFTTAFIKESQSFSELLADNLDLYVTHIEKVGDLDVLYTVSGGGVLKVSQSMPIEKSFKNLQSILGSEDFIHLQNGAFQYIDLRFGDKIFLNEEEKKENIEDTSTSADILPE